MEKHDFSYSEEQGLLVASGSGIFGIEPEQRGKAILIVDCPSSVRGLALHQGRLFAGGGSFGYGFIFNVERGKIKYYEDNVNSIIAHNNTVYATIRNSGLFDVMTGKRIRRFINYESGDPLLSNKNVLYQYLICGESGTGVYDVLSRRKIPTVEGNENRLISCMIAHNGKIYDGGSDGLYDTLEGKLVLGNCTRIYKEGEATYVLRTDEVRGNDIDINILVSHEGGLYCGGARRGLEDDEGVYKIDINTGRAEKISEKRGERLPVLHLFSHKKKLYDSSCDGIYDTLGDPSGKNPMWRFNEGVRTTLSVPIEIWGELVKKGKVVDSTYRTREEDMCKAVAEGLVEAPEDFAQKHKD